MLRVATVSGMYAFLLKLYAGAKFTQALARVCSQVTAEIVKRLDAAGSRRCHAAWIVECIIAWLNRRHRPAKIGNA